MISNVSKVGLREEDYIFIFSEYIKDVYEQDGISILRYYEEEIKRDFRNAYSAIRSMYSYKKSKIYNAKLTFNKNQKYVYDVIQALIPRKTILDFNVKTKDVKKGYEFLTMFPFGNYVRIHRIDLIAAILLFTEDFILNEISFEGIALKKGDLIAKNDFLIFSIHSLRDKIIVSIKIKGVITLEYEILA